MNAVQSAEAFSVAELPSPTRDPAQLAADLQLHGYCLIADFLPPEMTCFLRQRLADQGLAERDAGKSLLSIGEETWVGGPRQADDAGGWGRHIVQNLINKGDEFLPVLTDPLLHELMRGAFKNMPFYLSSYHGLILQRGSGAQVIHSDQMYVPDQTSFPYVVNVMVMLSDFTEENGATRVVPGSHKFGKYPPMATDLGIGVSVDQRRNVVPIETIPAVAPAGTAMLFEGRLWHGAGDNVSDVRRYSMTIYWALAFLRQQECMPASTHDDVYDRMTDELRALVGFKALGSVGRVEPNRPGARCSMENAWPYVGRLEPAVPAIV